MYADELILRLDGHFGTKWRQGVQEETLKFLINEWASELVGAALDRAMEDLPEEK
ncbi:MULTISPECIES: hypothetical protein [unclassified Acidocella]|uniref:hypothetical protein n=1 Tax=unclassified Acidocella TaxID=2648610 RepID=UPI0003479FBE|nr:MULTISPECIES: hypothetical protein [unclassified Acidocella]WBO58902.1 hypothetical protein GT370_17675 [Acidocella sp. MX-AZ03]